MKLLLDTHVLLWCLGDSTRLRAEVRRAIENPDNLVFASVVCAWEIEIKRQLGKLDVPDDLEDRLRSIRFAELPVRMAHVSQLRSLPPLHRDPFDRMLISQAIAHGLAIVTPDPSITQYPVRVVW